MGSLIGIPHLSCFFSWWLPLTKLEWIIHMGLVYLVIDGQKLVQYSFLVIIYLQNAQSVCN